MVVEVRYDDVSADTHQAVALPRVHFLASGLGGCNAHGISGSGGIGKLFVESLLDPKPSAYVKSLSPDRFSETSWTWEEARVQASRVYETYYGV